MEANDIMNLNNIIYRLYDTADAEQMKIDFLRGIRMLIPCSYASFLMAGGEKDETRLVNPCCDPESFCAAEEQYISMENVDHLLWIIHSDQSVVIRESRIVSEKKRLESPIYRECYRAYDIFDTLQLSIVHDRVFYGVLTLYRTTAEREFTEDDSFWLRMVSVHLGKRFHEAAGSQAVRTERAVSLEELRGQYSLTNRESEVLSLIFENLSDDEIAARACISPYTVKKHIQNIYRKLGISARWELLRFRH